MEFFDAIPLEEALKRLNRVINLRLEYEKVHIMESLGRVVYEDVISPEDVPGFSRATMDGYAVRARDTYGASESLPAIISIAGEVVMGKVPEIQVKPGSGVKIPTGGMLPEGADSVVMIEHTELLDKNTLSILKPVSPGDNIIEKGEDIKQGEVLIGKGSAIRPQDIGALAGVGYTEIKVVKKPVVSIISTGDEIIEPTAPKLEPGQIRDINSYTIGALVKEWGGIPRPLGIVEDTREQLVSALEEALEKSHCVVLSGGSSVGTRDLTQQVVSGMGEVILHGVSVKPGKPTLVGIVRGRPVICLPGHPVSAMITCRLFVKAVLDRFLGRAQKDFSVKLSAHIMRNLASAGGRTHYIGVKLKSEGDKLMAIPIMGKSSMISTMIKADGLAIIPQEKEGVEKGGKVEVCLF